MAEQVAGGRIDEEDSKGVQVDCLSQSTGNGRWMNSSLLSKGESESSLYPSLE